MRVSTSLFSAALLAAGSLQQALALRPKESHIVSAADALTDAQFAQSAPTKLVIERKRKASSVLTTSSSAAAGVVSTAGVVSKNKTDGKAGEEAKKKSATSSTSSSAQTINTLTTQQTRADPPPTEPPTETGVWQIHHTTTQHQKVPAGGYVYGSPLYGQNMASVRGAVPQKELPVSTTMSCVMILCAQFFLVLTGCAIAKTQRELSGTANSQPGPFLVALQAARSTLTFVPMVCCLFLACRMRAVQLAQGDSKKYGLPPAFMRNAMWGATTAIGVQCILVLLMPLLGRMPEVDEDGNLVIASDEAPRIDPRTGQPIASKSSSGGLAGKILAVLRGVSLVGLWASIVVLGVGAWIMEPPKAIWGDASNMENEKYPWPAPAVQVTMDQCALFFLVYGLSALFRELGPGKYAKALGFLSIAMSTVALAPMFCILFLGARMRALQMDPLTGSPQSWAQDAMIVVDVCMTTQVALILIIGFCVKGEVMRGNCEGDIRFRVQHPAVLFVLTVVRWLCLIGIYVGAIMVLYSVTVIEHPEGKDKTPPVSPAMRCVMILTTFYLLIYFGLFLGVTLRQQLPQVEFLGKLVKTFDHARSVVFFAPMMCVLFIGTRMRALQMTGNKGAPQGYAQDWMYLSTWSVTLQTVMCVLLGLCTGREVHVDEDGNVQGVTKAGGAGAYVMESVRYLCMIAMYGGACGLCYAIYDMTPENATGRGSLFPWGPVPEPVNPGELQEAVPAVAGSSASSFF